MLYLFIVSWFTLLLLLLLPPLGLCWAGLGLLLLLRAFIVPLPGTRGIPPLDTSLLLLLLLPLGLLVLLLVGLLLLF